MYVNEIPVAVSNITSTVTVTSVVMLPTKLTPTSITSDSVTLKDDSTNLMIAIVHIIFRDF